MNMNADRALKHRLDQRRQESKRIASSSSGGSRRSAGRNEKQDRAQLILDVGLRMKMRESQLNAAARATENDRGAVAPAETSLRARQHDAGTKARGDAAKATKSCVKFVATVAARAAIPSTPRRAWRHRPCGRPASTLDASGARPFLPITPRAGGLASRCASATRVEASMPKRSRPGMHAFRIVSWNVADRSVRSGNPIARSSSVGGRALAGLAPIVLFEIRKRITKVTGD